jgi:hypothetical protein
MFSKPLLVGLLLSSSVALADEVLQPTYSKCGENAACATFRKQENPNYFGNLNDKLITFYRISTGWCTIQIDAPVLRHGPARNTDVSVWVRINDKEATLKTEVLSGYRLQNYVTFSCPQGGRLAFQFAIVNQGEWDNNAGNDYRGVFE